MTYKVFWTNLGYFAQEEFESFDEAYCYGKGKCFDFGIWQGDRLWAGWDYFGGLRLHPLFEMGRLVATPGALEALRATGQYPDEFIRRHILGDWGDLTEEDKQENEFSLSRDLRIFSAYHLSDRTKIWVITEADRSVTTLLLPSEY